MFLLTFLSILNAIITSVLISLSANSNICVSSESAFIDWLVDLVAVGHVFLLLPTPSASLLPSDTGGTGAVLPLPGEIPLHGRPGALGAGWREQAPSSCISADTASEDPSCHRAPGSVRSSHTPAY